MDLFGLLFAHLGDAVKDESGSDAVGDAVAQGHEDAREEGGDRLAEVVPLDLPEGGQHHDADHHQGRGGGGEGDGADESGQKCADRKADGYHHAGQAGAAPGTDAGGALHIGGGVGGAQDGADGSGGGVGKQGAVHLGLEAGGGLHRVLVLVAEDAGAAAGADEGADGVKGIGQAEREDGDQHQGHFGGVGKEGRQARGGKDGPKGAGQLAARLGKTDRLGGDGDPHGDAQQAGHDDADQDGALDVAHQQDDGESQTDQEQPERRLVQGSQGGHARAEGDDAHVQDADVGHKDADAAADGVLQAAGDGLDDVLADLGDGDEDVQQAADEHHGQRLLPGEAQSEADGVDKEGVQAHAGGQSIGHIGHKAHDQGADHRGDDGGQEHGAPFHPRLAEQGGVDGDDVRHREEGGQAGHHFTSGGGAVRLQLKKFFHCTMILLFQGAAAAPTRPGQSDDIPQRPASMDASQQTKCNHLGAEKQEAWKNKGDFGAKVILKPPASNTRAPAARLRGRPLWRDERPRTAAEAAMQDAAPQKRGPGQTADELPAVGGLGRSPHILIGGASPAQADIFHHRVVKEAQRGFPDRQKSPVQPTCLLTCCQDVR